MIQLVITMLLPVSLITNVTVEAIKKILGNDTKYSSNALAIVVSAIISVVVAILYMIIEHISFGLESIATTIILIWASFIMSTCGYDKVTQLLKQLSELK